MVNNPKFVDSLNRRDVLKYGLRDPAPVQYFRWLKQIFTGDFGYSVTASAPVFMGSAIS